jgi:hypothetical protein
MAEETKPASGLFGTALEFRPINQVMVGSKIGGAKNQKCPCFRARYLSYNIVDETPLPEQIEFRCFVGGKVHG